MEMVLQFICQHHSNTFGLFGAYIPKIIFAFKMSISLAIVEDLEEVREGLQQYISLQPDLNCLATFSNAEDAIEDLPVLQPDIVIMDINLPGISGIECIRQIRNSHS